MGNKEIRKQRFDSTWRPFLLKSSRRVNFRPGDYVVDFWAEQTTTDVKAGKQGRKRAPAKFKLYGEGAMWRFKKSKWIKINGEDTEALLFDLVKEVHNFKFTARDYKTLELCVRDYLKRAAISERDILVDVPLSRLPKTIVSSFKKRLGPKKRRSASK